MTAGPAPSSGKPRSRRWLSVGLATIGGLALGAAAVAIWGSRAADHRARALAAERSLAQTRHGRIEYIDWGQGPPVLVVHGAGGGFDQGRLLAEAIGARGLRFIAISRFGYLGSDLPADPSPAAQAQACADLLGHLGIARASILAMSGGVPPALKFAELYPEQTARMVLLSSAPFSPLDAEIADRPLPTWAYSALLGNDAAYWALTKVARSTLRSAFDARPELLASASAEERRFADSLIDGFLPASARLSGVVNEGAAVDPRASFGLEAIRAPTLIAHSRDDRLNPVAIAEELGRRIPDARIIIWERGGHLLLGHHGELQEQVASFLSVE